MTLTFAKCLVPIEPIGEKILAGQEILLPPSQEGGPFLKKIQLFQTVGDITSAILVEIPQKLQHTFSKYVSMTRSELF